VRSQLGPPAVEIRLVSVSCTGFMIPAVDAHVAEALGLGPRLARLPITESGCAGGVVGLARAADYLAAYPDRAVLLLALEFSSLTFQRSDRSATNVVSSAIFGDGGAAAVLVGPRHPRAGEVRLRLRDRESVFFPGTAHLMGFELRNTGCRSCCGVAGLSGARSSRPSRAFWTRAASAAGQSPTSSSLPAAAA
jgi:alkylresorcinol/alkylpyrone synthase